MKDKDAIVFVLSHMSLVQPDPTDLGSTLDKVSEFEALKLGIPEHDAILHTQH